VRRLDAALVSDGLTSLSAAAGDAAAMQGVKHFDRNSLLSWILNLCAQKRRQAAADQSGVEPPHSKLCRTPNCAVLQTVPYSKIYLVGSDPSFRLPSHNINAASRHAAGQSNKA
jgi:hypothetical protein